MAALVFREPEALLLLSGADLYAPPLLAYELISVARKKALRRPKLRQSLAHALDVALALDIRWVQVVHREVFQLALATGLTTYNATYLWLSRSLNVPLVTFDKQLRAASQGQG